MSEGRLKHRAQRVDSSSQVQPTHQQERQPLVNEGRRHQQQPSQQGNFKTEFDHSVKFGCVLVPVLLMLVILGGSASFLILLVGCMAVYLFDATQNTEAALVVWWLTVIGVWVSIVICTFATHGLTLFLLVAAPTVAMLVVCTGIWGTLSMGWQQHLPPPATLLAERILFTHTLVPVTTVIVWVVLSSSESAIVCPASCAVVCTLYILFSLPTPSSFRPAQDHRVARRPVLSKIESTMHTCYVITLPFLLYVSLHSHTILLHNNNNNNTNTTHNINILALLAFPLFVLSILSLLPRCDALWWLELHQSAKVHLARVCAIVTATFLGLWIEMRVIFQSYSAHMSVPSPYCHILVTISIFSSILTISLHAMSLLHRLGLVGVNVMVVASFFGVVVSFGAPWFVVVLLLLGSHVFTRFYFDKDVRKYVLFVLVTMMGVSWFAVRQFWFLSFTFTAPELSVQTTTVLLISTFGLSLTIPGIALVKETQPVTTLLLVVHTTLVTILELTLHHSFSHVYPSYLVVLTTGLGCVLTRHLLSQKRVGDGGALLLFAFYFSKLGVLLEEVSSPFALLSLVLLFLWATQIGRFQPLDLFTFLPYVAFSALSCRFALVPVILPLSNLALGDVASNQSLHLAVFIISWSVMLMPMSGLGGARITKLKRWNVLLLTFGVLLALVQPTMNMDLVVDSVVVTATGLHTVTNPSLVFRPLWADWSLLMCSLFAVGSLLQIVPTPKSTLLRPIPPSIFGVVFGLTMSARYLPTNRVVYTVFCFAFSVSSLLVYLCVSPSAAGMVSTRKFVFALFEASLPIGYIVVSFAVPVAQRVQGPYMRYMSQFLYVCTFLAVHVSLALFLKVRIHRASRRVAAKYDRRFVSGAGTADNSGDMTAQPHTATLLNFLTLMGFLLAVVVVMFFVNGTTTSVCFLAPILLCLHQDQQMLPTLTDERRYFPLLLSSSMTYAISCLLDLVGHVVHSHIPAVAQSAHPVVPSVPYGFEAWTSWETTKHLLLFFVTVPALTLSLAFLWNFQRQSDLLWYILLPLNVFPAYLSALSSLRALGVMSVVGGLFYFGTTWHITARGHQVI